MIRTHPLFQPVMGLAPFVALSWKTGAHDGETWESGHILEHQEAILSPTPLKCDAVTDNHSLYAVGYGVGKLFEDDCFDPCSLSDLQAEAVGVHLHQLCTFIATNVDPLPFAEPMVVTDAAGLSQYIARAIHKPSAVNSVDDAINRLLSYFDSR